MAPMWDYRFVERYDHEGAGLFATLRDVPCFCTPERPELGRPDYCLKHIVLARLDRDALTEGVQQTLGVGG